MTASLTSNPNQRDKAIRAQGLTRRFGNLVAVDHLDLEVAYGEAFALVGPDAAGKTTTMRLLVGIMDPDEGRAERIGQVGDRAACGLGPGELQGRPADVVDELPAFRGAQFRRVAPVDR